MLGLLHPLGRGHDGVDPRLEQPRGHDLPRRLGLGHQPLEASAPRRSSCRRAATPPAPSRSCAAPTRGPARSSRAARRAARRRWSCSTSTTRTSTSSSGARRKEEDKARGARGTPASTCRSTGDWASIQYQNANNSVRVTDEFMEAVVEGERVEPHRPHRRHRRRDGRRARADARDRRGRVALRRPGRPVRHDDQRVAHVPELGPHQRVEPVLASTCTSTTRPATSPRST